MTTTWPESEPWTTTLPRGTTCETTQNYHFSGPKPPTPTPNTIRTNVYSDLRPSGYNPRENLDPRLICTHSNSHSRNRDEPHYHFLATNPKKNDNNPHDDPPAGNKHNLTSDSNNNPIKPVFKRSHNTRPTNPPRAPHILTFSHNIIEKYPFRPTGFNPSEKKPGGLGEGGHQSHPGDPRERHHAQPAGVGVARGPEHLEPAHQAGHRGRPGRVHVPAQHRPDEEPGEFDFFFFVIFFRCFPIFFSVWERVENGEQTVEIMCKG